MLRDYYYAIVYAVSVMAFIAANEPRVIEDYYRAATLGAVVLIVLWTVTIAWIYTTRFHALPCDRRGRMLAPKRVWGMGVAFLLALSDNVAQVMSYFGGDLIRLDGVPLLIAILGAATYWLWPLIHHELKMREREREIQ